MPYSRLFFNPHGYVFLCRPVSDRSRSGVIRRNTPVVRCTGHLCGHGYAPSTVYAAREATAHGPP